MKIDLQARHFSATKALRNHVTRRLGFALSAGAEHIQRVLVKLSADNGPRGSVDKRCQIQLVLPRQPDIVIEDSEANLYVAIDRAANRAGRTLRRRLARHRDAHRALQYSRYQAIG